MNAKLMLLSRFFFVADLKQLRELTEVKEENLKGLLVFVDSNLTLPRKKASKLVSHLFDLMHKSEGLGINFLLVANNRALVDKRIASLITHGSKITSYELNPKEVRL